VINNNNNNNNLIQDSMAAAKVPLHLAPYVLMQKHVKCVRLRMRPPLVK